MFDITAEIDYSLLEGRDFTCLENCGFCCTFPAEVRECEPSFNEILKIDRNGLKKWETDDPYFCNVYTMRQHQDRGACIFLRDDRRCGIYPARSLLCRIFPVKIFFGHRIQLYTSQICRGFSQDSNSGLRRTGEEIMEQLPALMKEEMIREAREMYDSLPGELPDYIAPRALQARLLDHVNTMSLSSTRISERSKTAFKSQLSSDEFIDLPTYLTEDMQWLVFRLKEGIVEKMKLERTGEVRTIGSINHSSFSPRPLTADATEVLRDYLKRIVKRDHFAGVAYLRALKTGNEKPLANIALEYLDDIASSLILRASLLSGFEGLAYIDANMIRETVVFSDGYLATEPSYGLIL